jgi:DNA-binding Xre family transcriptional regulator
MIAISDNFLNSLLRSKGMLTITQLSEATGINRFTLHDVLTGKRKIVQKGTYTKLVDWLASTTAQEA